jgi:HlyD family secretion protein
MKRLFSALVVLVCALAFVLYAELRAQRMDLQGDAGSSGTVEGTEVRVVARLGARVAAVRVREGDRVEAGQLVAELECNEPRAQLRQAKAAVALAEARVVAALRQLDAAKVSADALAHRADAAAAQTEAAKAQINAVEARRAAAQRNAARVDRMVGSGGVTERDVDQSAAAAAELVASKSAVRHTASAAEAERPALVQQVAAARNQAAAAEAQVAVARADVARAEESVATAELLVAECAVKSPTSGVIQTRNFEPGEVVGPGSAIATVIRTDALWVRFYVPNAELEHAQPGRSVRIVADAVEGEVFQGAIRVVGQQAEFTPRNVQTREDRDRLVYRVEADVVGQAGALRPGMPVEVRIADSAPEAP